MSVHRLKRPLRARWLPRILLVAAGLAGIWLAVMPSTGPQVSVLVAKTNIFEGDALAAEDFETKSFNLGTAAGNYLTPDSLPQKGFARRDILAGELAPKTAIGLPSGSLVPMAITLTQSLPRQITAGRTVDVWSTQIHLGQVDGNPEPIALAAKVSALSQNSNMGQTRTTVEILVSSDYIAPLLLAQADGSIMSLVLNPTAADG